MRDKFRETPMCEECGEKPAFAFCCLGHPETGLRWVYACQCTDNADYCAIEFDRFFGHAASTVDFLAHLNEKLWMNWADFMTMIGRFRNATKSYDSM